MKNFSDLLATKLELNVLVNGQEITAGLLDELTFNANDIVIIDGEREAGQEPRFEHGAQRQALADFGL